MSETKHLTLEQFPHNHLIAAKKIGLSSLDEDLRIILTDFNKRYNGYLMKKNPDTLKVLLAHSNKITQELYDYYVEPEEQKVDISPNKPITGQDIKNIVKDIKDNEAIDNGELIIDNSKKQPINTPAPVVKSEEKKETLTPAQDDFKPSGKNEAALHELYKAKRTEGISRKELSESGFDISTWGPLGVRGCKVGRYRLSKEFSDTLFKLSLA